MKIFIYKTIILSIALIFLFEFLIGSKIKKYEKTIYQLGNKENVEFYKEKFFKELSAATKKDKYFTDEQRIILIDFFSKIKLELSTEINK